jgi:hypothetical protein
MGERISHRPGAREQRGALGRPAQEQAGDAAHQPLPRRAGAEAPKRGRPAGS